MQNFEETTKMRNKVPVMTAVLMAAVIVSGAGCSKESTEPKPPDTASSAKTVEDHAAEARKLIDAQREKAKADCGIYLMARGGSGRVRYTDEKGPDKKGSITVVGTFDVSAEGEQLSFKCTLTTSDGPIYNLVNLELYKIEPTSAGTSK